AAIDSFASYAHEQWGQRLYADDYVNSSMIDGGSAEATDASGESGAKNGDTLTATLTNRRLISRLKAFLRFENGRARRIGDDLFTAGLAAQKHMLRGLFSADANVTGETVELVTENKGLLEDLQLLLLGFGVQSTITEHGEGGALATGGGGASAC